ncbi:MAG: MarR family winged helix-turn-helix transcriptional regulator [Pseudonocardiaceae bacterium]
MGVTDAASDNPDTVGQPMVTTEDARWLAGYLRKMVGTRPSAWAGSEVTLSQLIALHVISAKSPMTLLSLSEALGTRPPATSAMVDRLARAGLVRRTPDPTDLRRVMLAVTSTAAQMIGKIDPDTARRLQTVLTTMGSAAQRVLTEVLKDTARRLSR